MSEINRLALPPGAMIAEYRLEKMLGKGGFGITYLGIDTRLGMKVAIKELLPDGIAMRGEGSTVVAQTRSMEETYQWAVQRFEEEARVLARLKHGNIVGVHRFIEANGTVYAVMEYVEGRSLGDLLRERGGALDEPTARGILAAMMDGLAYVHEQGLLHRDVKPDNIFITAEGKPVLLDFGSARQDLGRSTSMTAVVSMGYSPFEQYQTHGNQGPFTDIHALAATMIHAITGEKPIAATDRYMEPEPQGWLVGKLRGKYSEDFLRALERGFAVRAADRPQTIAEWRKSLEDPAAGETRIVAPPPPPLPRVPWALLAGAGAALAIVLAVAGYFVLGRKPAPEPAVASSPAAGAAPVATPSPTPADDPQSLFDEGIRALTGSGEEPRRGVALLTRAAEGGHTGAQKHLFAIHAKGLAGVPKDPAKGLAYLEQAAASGDKESRFNMGVVLSKGEGVEKDDARAAEWYRKAAEAGYPGAQLNLGMAYAEGRGVEKDDEQAVEWYRKAADGGVALAQFNLGNRYLRGDGVPQDTAAAVQWYEKAAGKGEVQSQYNLGVFYEQGEGVPQDNEAAAEWYRKAAAQGHGAAEYNLSVMMFQGRGVPQDRARALELCRSASERGVAAASFALAQHYASGNTAEKDDEKALRYCRDAAEKGWIPAQHALGLIYYQGQLSEKDFAQAAYWFRKAAEQGWADAQHDLGYLYERGEGVEKSRETAMEWYRKAAGHGHRVAAERLRRME